MGGRGNLSPTDDKSPVRGGILTGLEDVGMKKGGKLHFILPLKTPIIVPYSN
jgi:hypothetical protein